MLHQRVVLVALCVAVAVAGRLPQRYLPSNQYLAPQPQAAHSQLHYHGVSGGGGGGGGHSRIGGIAGGGASASYAGHGHGHAVGHGHAAVAGAHRQTPQIPIVRSDYQSDASGNYNFGFDTGNGIHRDETGEFKGGWPHGSLGVRGSYSYTGDDGQQYTVNYKADKNGFQAEGAHLPTSPSLPADPHQHRSAAAGYHGNGYHGAASSPASSSRYLPPGYRQRRHY